VQRPGKVSVWVGKFDDEAQFFSHVEKSYGDDETTSDFIAETAMEDFDEDFAEGAFFEPGNPASLADVSYFASFGERLYADLNGRAENAAYFIYDMATAAGPPEAQLHLLGVYPYQQR
jgi:hypothetical protein